MPNKKRLKLLCDALKRYKKRTKFSLKNKEGRCPLGIFCEVYKKHTKRGKWIYDESDKKYEFVVTKNDRSTFRLPDGVAKWYGFPSGYVDVWHQNKLRSIAFLNDYKIADFKKIAQLIEETFLNEKKKTKETKTTNKKR